MYNTKNPLEVQNLRLKIEKLIEKQSMVEVVEKKAKTLQQLKYLHTILAYFGLQTGNTLDEVKTCYFKRIVNRDNSHTWHTAPQVFSSSLLLTCQTSGTSCH